MRELTIEECQEVSGGDGDTPTGAGGGETQGGKAKDGFSIEAYNHH